MRKIVSASIVGLAVLLAFSTVPLQVVAQTPTVILEGGTLIDGTGRNPINNAVVVIEGNRIKSVGTKGQVSYPSNATVINTDGRTILPGLVDGHVHLDIYYPSYMAQMLLHYGVTTMADLNNQTDWILLQREALNSGKVKGPRMFVSGAAADGPTSTTNTDERVIVNALRTPEEARAYVRTLVAKGVDMIKTNYSLTYDQLAAIVDEAKKAGVPVVGHSRNIRKATELGLKYAEHMNTIAWALADDDMAYERSRTEGFRAESQMDPRKFPALIQFMVKEGVFVNPTFIANWGGASPRAQQMGEAAKQILKDPTLTAIVPDAAQQAWMQRASSRGADVEGFKKVQEFIREYVNAGGKITAGTDDGGAILPGLSLHYEMQMLTDAGLPPMKVIQAATLWAAESFGQGKNLGSIEPGKLADFTIIEGNPLNDIAATRNVKMVIKDGKVVDTAYDRNALPRVPRPFTSVPHLSAISPAVTKEGTRMVTLQIDGVGFTSKSIVRFDNRDLPTQFVSASKLTATVDASLLQKAGSYAVYVVNVGSDGQGGGASNNVFLFVNSD
jgi:imidazolonepropionase-like amidohydrolase